MSRLRHKRFALGVGDSDLCVIDAANMRLLTSLPLADYLPGAASPQTADWWPSMEAALAQVQLDVPDGGDLVFTVSDVWVRYFILTLPEGVGSLNELRALAAGRFESLFGTPSEGWHMAADWKPGGRMLVCAMPQRLIDVSKLLTDTSHWRVRSIQPYSLRLIAHFYKQIPDDCWVCCFAQRGVFALLIVDGEVRHARRFPFNQTPDIENFAGLLEAEALRSGLEMPGVLCALGVLPEVPVDGRVCGMNLVLVQGERALRTRHGRTSESLNLAMQGAL